MFLEVDDFLTCLNAAISSLYAKKGRVNIADFSRRAGFSSRSYVSELLRGQKGLSRDALRRIQAALKLPKYYTEILEYLAFVENPEVNIERIPESELKARIKRVRRKIQLKCAADSVEPKPIVSPMLIGQINFYKVYASLGSVEEGALFSEIQQRCGLSESTLVEILNLMRSSGVARLTGLRYVAILDSLDKFGLSLESGLSSLLLEVSSSLRARRAKIINSPRDRVVFTSFSMQSNQVAAFRARLNKAIFEVIDEFQDDAGDSIRQVFYVNTDAL